MTAPKTALLLLAAAAALVLQHYYGLMPDPMASHFDASGKPDGYQSRDGFFLLSCGILLVTVALFGAMGPLLRRIPPELVSLPNRDYWLAPERRDATFEFIARQMDWFGVATTFLLALVLSLACEANLAPEPRLDSASMWWLLGGYLVFTTLWLVRFVMHYRAPSGETAPPPAV